jgi:probable O-glycosylation ligase (exosortase A-associated)
MAAIAIIPMAFWLARHGTIFPRHWTVTLFALALTFACLLIPVGTEARTGLICIGVLAVLALRTARRRFLYMSLMAIGAFAAVPFLPQSYTSRLSTIENHQADESASTRLAVWAWTWEYAKDHPMGGGFEAYRSNKVRYQKKTTTEVSDDDTEIVSSYVVDAGRAYHSAYFEMLGEQGYPGLALWLWLQLAGLWQMERIRWKWKKRTGPDEQWQAPLANALQLAQVVYLVGAAFTGIAYQPFILMLIGLQCGLWSYLKRIDTQRIDGAARRIGGAPRTLSVAAQPAPAPEAIGA